MVPNEPSSSASATSWLDYVLATPTIGVRFEAWLATGPGMLEALRPLIEAQTKRGAKFQVNADALTAQLTRNDGVTYAVTPDDITVQFGYNVKVVDDAERVARVENVDIQQYSITAPKVRDELRDVLRALVKTPRVLHRVGVVAACQFGEASLPPGVAAFLRHIGRPWGNEPLALFNGTVLSELASTAETKDRCHHTVNLDRENRTDGAIRFNLDWQRLYRQPGELSADRVMQRVVDCIRDANVYFERFGTGDLNYAA